MAGRWIQNAHPKKGALHRQLNYPMNHPLPPGTLHKIVEQGLGSHVQTPGGSVTITAKLKKRANFALNVRQPP